MWGWQTSLRFTSTGYLIIFTWLIQLWKDHLQGKSTLQWNILLSSRQFSCTQKFLTKPMSYVSCCTAWDMTMDWHTTNLLYVIMYATFFATSRKVAGSIPDGVIEIFHWHNRSGRTMALGLTQLLTEISTRNISWGGVKAAGALGWQNYHLHVPNVLKYGSLNLLEPSGPVQGCNGIALPFALFSDV